MIDQTQYLMHTVSDRLIHQVSLQEKVQLSMDNYPSTLGSR